MLLDKFGLFSEGKAMIIGAHTALPENISTAGAFGEFVICRHDERSEQRLLEFLEFASEDHGFGRCSCLFSLEKQAYSQTLFRSDRSSGTPR